MNSFNKVIDALTPMIEKYEKFSNRRTTLLEAMTKLRVALTRETMEMVDHEDDPSVAEGCYCNLAETIVRLSIASVNDSTVEQVFQDARTLRSTTFKKFITFMPLEYNAELWFMFETWFEFVGRAVTNDQKLDVSTMEAYTKAFFAGSVTLCIMAMENILENS